MVDSYGLYEIKLHLDGGYITAEKLEGYFLVGTIGDGDTWRAESAYFIGKEPKAITYTWKAQDPASWLGSDIAAIKIIYVDADGNVTWYGAADGNNVMIPKVGAKLIAADQVMVMTFFFRPSAVATSSTGPGSISVKTRFNGYSLSIFTSPF